MNKLYILIALITSTIFSLQGQVTAIKDKVNGKEDSTMVIQVQNNDVTEIGCTNETTILIPAYHGIAIRKANNQDIEYTPNNGYFGADSFKYQLKGCITTAKDSAWVVINVIPINQKPVANDDQATTNEDQSILIDVQGNDFDRELSILSTTILTNPKNGMTIVPNLDSVRYIPNKDFNGKDSFQYVICDNSQGTVSLCDTAWVFITVLPVGDPLYLVKKDTLITTPEETKICIDITNNIIDPDKEYNWTTTISAQAANGTATVKDNIFCYTPNLNFNGIDSAKIKICDTSNNCVIMTVKINVTPVDDTIKAKNDTLYLAVNSKVTFDPGVNDTNIDRISYTATMITYPKNGFATYSGNTYTYTPNTGFYGIDSQKYAISSSSIAYQSYATIYYYVGVTPDKPDAKDDYYVLNMNQIKTFDPTSNDWMSQYQPNSIRILKAPTKVNLVKNNTGFNMIATSSNILGTDTCYYELCNAINKCDTAMIIIVVSDNYAPVLTKDTSTLINGIDFGDCLKKLVYDSDTPFTYSISNPTKNFNLILQSDGCWTYSYDSTYEGFDSFVFVVCDNGKPVRCDSMVHYVKVVKLKDDITINNSMSPNGDNILDHFQINDLNVATSNYVKIFNRWGDIVYEKSNYKNDWYGTNEKSGPNQGEVLPDGVYYYIVDYTIHNRSKTKTGYIYLKK